MRNKQRLILNAILNYLFIYANRIGFRMLGQQSKYNIGWKLGRLSNTYLIAEFGYIFLAVLITKLSSIINTSILHTYVS